METIENLISIFTNNPIKTSAIITSLPYLTRAWYVVVNGGGIKGILRAIWSGTNTPKTEETKNIPVDATTKATKAAE